MAINQYYHFSIVLYHYPTEDLLILLGVEQYAFIEHLFDINENGELKKSHFHLYLKLKKKKTCGGVFNILNKWKENCTQSFLIQNLDNPPNFIRYLIHADDLDKYQYSINDIVSNFDLQPYFNLNLSDSVFVNNVLELINRKELKNFKELVYYSIQYSKLDLILKRSYFFKSLL